MTPVRLVRRRDPRSCCFTTMYLSSKRAAGAADFLLDGLIILRYSPAGQAPTVV